MTVLETWLVEMVEVAVRHPPGDLDVYTTEEWSTEWLEMGQRVAILLVQARAIECRHLAGELAIKYGNAASAIIQGCWDRSHKLEAIGLMLAQQWPPVDGSEVMVCRCAIESGEVPKDDVWVCATCKLPKHGNSGNGPVMVTQ